MRLPTIKGRTGETDSITSKQPVKLMLQSIVLWKNGATALEEAIDRFQTELPPLRQFILAGGGNGGALLHVARTVCRRAERRVVSLSEKIEVNPNVIEYLNRLSDFLFVIARIANHREGKQEILW